MKPSYGIKAAAKTNVIFLCVLNLASRHPGQVDSSPVCTEDYECFEKSHSLFDHEMERLISQLAEHPVEMSKLFALLLLQCDVKIMASNIMQNAGKRS